MSRALFEMVEICHCQNSKLFINSILSLFIIFLRFRFKDAWGICLHLCDKDSWVKLGKAALQQLDMDFGKCSIKMCNNVVYIQ